jgi:hypothetical protein
MTKKTWVLVAITLLLLLWFALAGIAASRGGFRLFPCCSLPPLEQSAER